MSGKGERQGLNLSVCDRPLFISPNRAQLLGAVRHMCSPLGLKADEPGASDTTATDVKDPAWQGVGPCIRLLGLLLQMATNWGA